MCQILMNFLAMVQIVYPKDFSRNIKITPQVLNIFYCNIKYKGEDR